MDSALENVSGRLKAKMKRQMQYIIEGNGTRQKKKPLNQMYTKLYITKARPIKEHELCKMDSSVQPLPGEEIESNNIFQNADTRTVLTKGTAGIGKSVCTQKFILDWSEGQANQNVKLMFLLPFRDLNLLTEEYSLHTLLMECYPELRELKKTDIYNSSNTLFILDGLDESRFHLNFKSKPVTDMNKITTVDVLITSLIRGTLLDSALLWITSRPAAVTRALSLYIDQETEVRGFKDPEKEKYFYKNVCNPELAETIISHIKSSRVLHVMCHIPLFCWLAATIFQNLLEKDKKKEKEETRDKEELPKTLTTMYCHFLLIQTDLTYQKNHGTNEGGTKNLLEYYKDIILRVAELAYKQFVKERVIFYKKDLEECGVDANNCVFSDMCNEMLKEEPTFYVDCHVKIYSFVHLSIQEFLAALYAFHCFLNNTVEPLKSCLALQKGQKALPEEFPIEEFLKMAVNKGLDNKIGHFDLFVKFLHGFTLASNQKVLDGLLHLTCDAETRWKIKSNLKKIQRRNISAERCINLFHCLSEMNDCSVQKEVEGFLNSEKGCVKMLSLAHCSGLAYMLQLSEVQEVFDLTKYNTSDEGRKRLVPAVKNCRKAILAGCKLTENSCDIVASALQSENSSLRELDMSDNDLQDSGLKILCDGLKSSHCKLKKLKLSCCGITQTGCEELASALRSHPSCLRELDLSRNYPGAGGKKALSKIQKRCTINFDDEAEYWLKSGLRKYTHKITLDPNSAHRRLRWTDPRKLTNQKVSVDKKDEPYSDHPERFQHCQEFLCRESMRGKFYWDVDWNGHATIGIAYKSIRRDGQDESKLGCNTSSWSLECFIGSYVAKHNNLTENIPAPRSHSGRVGVFLDWEGGTLSFYSVSSGTLSHLHTFSAKFAEPVYPGFEVSKSITICQPTKRKASDS
ncbi:hypothetical protein ACEWY4_017362 [Coilia grayii]|uniref:Uncharacterized protein n=1 Tax=Coilia grayii TaxID=363190 RepID=A0ABD1JGL8_9TELE